MTLPLPTEQAEQQAFIHWLELQGLKYTAIPNETGHTTEAYRRATRMKRNGVRKGFPDLIVLVPPERSRDGLGYFLAIELKRQKGGVVSPEQREWIDAINDLNSPTMQAGVCKGLEEAIVLVTSYMKGTV